jgi:hypothetical protein
MPGHVTVYIYEHMASQNLNGRWRGLLKNLYRFVSSSGDWGNRWKRGMIQQHHHHPSTSTALTKYKHSFTKWHDSCEVMIYFA